MTLQKSCWFDVPLTLLGRPVPGHGAGALAFATKISFKNRKWLKTLVSCRCPIPLRDTLDNTSIANGRPRPGGRALPPGQHWKGGPLGSFPTISNGQGPQMCFPRVNSNAINHLTSLPHSAGKCNKPGELTQQLGPQSLPPHLEVLPLPCPTSCSCSKGSDSGVSTPPHWERARGWHLPEKRLDP